MVGSMVSCFWYSVARENAVALAWKEMEGSWKCEVGYGFRKSYMEMFGERLIVEVVLVRRAVGSLEVSR